MVVFRDCDNPWEEHSCPDCDEEYFDEDYDDDEED